MTDPPYRTEYSPLSVLPQTRDPKSPEGGSELPDPAFALWHIIQWTSEQFGDKQAVVYAETLSMALAALTEGPSIPGAKERDRILKGLLSLHVARQGRKGRHFIMFRLGPGDSGDVIEVLRLLHDSMDLPRPRPDSATLEVRRPGHV